MDPSMLRARYREFVRLIPERVAALESEVRASGAKEWNGDMTPQSLQLLYTWLQRRATTRRRPEAERADLRRNCEAAFEIRETDLSDETVSFVYDIAMYCASVLLHRHPNLQWSVDLRSMLDFNYGQPIIIGFAGG